jgi:fatty-acyl-CoA synthase
MEHHWATVWEGVADAMADRPALVQGSVRRTWREYDDRASRFAGALSSAGIGHGARIAQYLYNSTAYAESYFGTLKHRCVPVNVNYRYLDEELEYLLNNAEAEALLFHSSLGDRVARVAGNVPTLKLLLEVDDGGPLGQVDRSVPYDEALSAADPAPRIQRSPDDVTMLYTGGTTGMPKGVVSKIGPHVASLIATVAPMIGAAPPSSLDEVPGMAAAAAESGRQLVAMPACPLMHGTGMGIGMVPPMGYGGCVVLLEGRRFDADELWSTVERERVSWIAVVGDAFARPMLRALRDSRAGGEPGYDTSSMRWIGSSGAMFSAEIREGLIDEIPQLLILDYISSSEGLMGVAMSRTGDVVPTGRFTPVPGVKVFAEGDRPVEPGSGEAGIVGLSAGVPEEYFKDAAKSSATFRVVDGVRYSFPGDWAVVEADGSLTLLGRGSQCINTGGEKVFPEEVEEVIKRHDAIDDCLVFGLPDERFGQRVCAVASAAPGAAAVDVGDVLAEARRHLAGYKVPRELRLVDAVPRAANGKADYKTARQLFESTPQPT